MRLPVVILVFILFLSRSSSARELIEPWVSVRALGMGNAYTAVVDDSDSLFYNPAALCKVSGLDWTIVDPRVGGNGLQAVEVATELADSSDLASSINSLYGKSLWLGGGAKTAVAIPCFGATAFVNSETSLLLSNPAFPEMSVSSVFDYGIGVGAAAPLIPGIWSIGVNLRRVNRTGTQTPISAGTLADLNTDQILNRLRNRGNGYGMDLGMIATLPLPVRPTFALTWRNVGYTTFTFEEGEAAPPAQPPELTVGGSLSLDLPLISITPAIDLRYLDRTDIALGKKIHMGAEIDLPILAVRAGLYQGYYTAGASFSLGLLQFEAATYGVELGEYPGQLEDRRYVLQMTIGLGFDGFSGKTWGRSEAEIARSSGSRARRKLKQRR